MIDCPPRAPVILPGAPYGRYEVVLAGAVLISGRTLFAPGFRYVDDSAQAVPLKAGPDGARLMLLAFDQDACEGGLTGDRLSVAAAEAMERAI
jgi:hypothetical protein